MKPKINEKGIIQIKNGRHPVVEQMMKDELFVANDTYLDNGKNRVSSHHRPQYGGKIHLYAPDGADRADGADRQLRTGG